MIQPLRARAPGSDYRRAMPIRIALGEDSLLVREGVLQLLSDDPAVEIVAAVGDAGALREACDHHRPDVVLTDIRMPPTNSDEGIRLAQELRDTHPEMGVVVLSQFSDPQYALALLDRGTDRRAYLLKERVHNRAELMAAIRAVAGGGAMIDPNIVEALVRARSRASTIFGSIIAPPPATARIAAISSARLWTRSLSR